MLATHRQALLGSSSHAQRSPRSTTHVAHPFSPRHLRTTISSSGGVTRSHGGIQAPTTTAPVAQVPTLEDALAIAQQQQKIGFIDEQPLAAQRPLGMRLRTGACCLPHPDKHHYGGEDAFFVSSAGGGALGVADGVGGWADSGVNPAQYSRTLMRVACAYVEGAEGEDLARAAADGLRAEGADNSVGGGSYASVDSEEAYAYAFSNGGVVAAAAVSGGSTAAGASRAYVDPRAALDAAHRRTRCPGSATAVVVQLDSVKRRLVAANLGDSGFMVVRGGSVVARSRPLQHFFDCPLQLGAYPEFVDATDTAAQAEMFEVPLRAGDVIVAGSDGLWDNMYDRDILGLLPSSADEAQAASESIAAAARAHASDPSFPSPYTREALQQGYDISWLDKLRGVSFRDGKLELAQLTGGKQDDITVLVAVVEDDA